MITKNFNEIKYKFPEGLSLKQIEILEWAVTAYAFVMWPRTKFTFGELADAISNYYDRNTPQTSEAIQVLHAAQDGVQQKGEI